MCLRVREEESANVFVLMRICVSDFHLHLHMAMPVGDCRRQSVAAVDRRNENGWEKWIRKRGFEENFTNGWTKSDIDVGQRCSKVNCHFIFLFFPFLRIHFPPSNSDGDIFCVLFFVFLSEIVFESTVSSWPPLANCSPQFSTMMTALKSFRLILTAICWNRLCRSFTPAKSRWTETMSSNMQRSLSIGKWIYC